MFPAYIKGRAVAVATCFNWATNLIVSVTFLDFISKFIYLCVETVCLSVSDCLCVCVCVCLSVCRIHCRYKLHCSQLEWLGIKRYL